MPARKPAWQAWRLALPFARGGGDGVPGGVAGAGVVGGQRGPIGTGDAVEVVDHLTVANGQLADQAPRAVHTGAVHVGEAEFAGFDAQHGDVRGRAHGEVAELLVMDLASRI